MSGNQCSCQRIGKTWDCSLDWLTHEGIKIEACQKQREEIMADRQADQQKAIDRGE